MPRRGIKSVTSRELHYLRHMLTAFLFLDRGFLLLTARLSIPQDPFSFY